MTPPAYAWRAGPTRSLAEYLADLTAQLRLLPLESKARGAVISRIRAVEAEIDARSGA